MSSSENNLVHMPTSAVAHAALGDVLFDREAFAHLRDVAQVLADSQMIPSHFRGKWQDVLLGCALAKTLGENPLILLQGLHVIQGKVGFSAQFMIARVNASGKLRGPIRYKETGEGEGLAVTATATLAATGEDVSITVSVAMAKAEGWLSKNPKWRSMPQLMARYRSAAFLIRTHFPEVLLGYHEVHELLDSARHPSEPEYEDPPHASPPSSSPTRGSGAGRAALSSGGRALQAAANEDGGPSLALSTAAFSSSPGGAVESATSFTAASAGAAGPDGLEGFESPTPASPSPAPAPSTPVPGGDPAAQAAGPGEGQRAHDPSFTREEQKRFFAKVGELGLNKDLVCELAATRPGNARPSQMGQVRRDRFLAWLQTPDGVAAYEQLLEQKEREAQAAEEGAPIAIEAFPSPEAAISWGMHKGAFATIEQARQAYETVKHEGLPANAEEMAAMWVAEVTSRIAAKGAEVLVDDVDAAESAAEGVRS